MLVKLRIAVADFAAGNGEEVLHHEGEPGERPGGASGKRLRQAMRDEGVNRVAGRNGDHALVAMPLRVQRAGNPLYHRGD